MPRVEVVRVPPVNTPEYGECREDGLQSVRAGGAASATIHDTVEPTAASVSQDLGQTVHSINCGIVVPLEDDLDPVLHRSIIILRRMLP